MKTNKEIGGGEGAQEKRSKWHSTGVGHLEQSWAATIIQAANTTAESLNEAANIPAPPFELTL